MAKYFKPNQTFKPVWCQIEQLQVEAGKSYLVMGQSKSNPGYWIKLEVGVIKWNVFLTDEEFTRGEVLTVNKRTR